MRESPALDVIELLRQKGADVRYHDPYVTPIRHSGYRMQGDADLDAASFDWAQDAALAEADCAVVVTAHSCYTLGGHQAASEADR